MLISNYKTITKQELIKLYWEKIKNGTLTHEASYKRLHELIKDIKRTKNNIPRVVKLIEQEIKWEKKKGTND